MSVDGKASCSPPGGEFSFIDVGLRFGAYAFLQPRLVSRQGTRVYWDGTDSFRLALLDGLSAMATDNAASTISISYGEDEAL